MHDIFADYRDLGVIKSIKYSWSTRGPSSSAMGALGNLGNLGNRPGAAERASAEMPSVAGLGKRKGRSLHRVGSR